MNKAKRACEAAQKWEETAEQSRKRQGRRTDLSQMNGDNWGQTRDLLSKTYDVSANYIQRARNLMLSDPDTFQRVLSGEIPFPTAPPSPGVYLIHMDGTDFFKIGVSTNSITDRIASLQTGSPVKLVLRGWLDSGSPHQLEAELHSRFAVQRQEGEWFKFTANEFESVFHP